MKVSIEMLAVVVAGIAVVQQVGMKVVVEVDHRIGLKPLHVVQAIIYLDDPVPAAILLITLLKTIMNKNCTLHLVAKIASIDELGPLDP
jgi:alpha-D-ribose 1-methylphosphonate 5-phosphate C-P lyase